MHGRLCISQVCPTTAWEYYCFTLNSILGYLVNWTLAIYGTATDPLRNNTHVRGFFRNTSTTRKFCLKRMKSFTYYLVFMQPYFTKFYYIYPIHNTAVSMTSNNQRLEKCVPRVLLLYNRDLYVFWLTTYHRHVHKLVLLKFTIKQLELV